MKKPYELGYEDGYRDCKETYSKIINTLREDRDNYKKHAEILEWKLQVLNNETKYDRKLIKLGQAVKEVVKGIKYDC